MRANTSDSTVGSLAWPAEEPAGSIRTSCAELGVPASNSSPPIRIPLTSAVDRIVLPPLDTSVAMPGPSTTVSGFVTLIVPLIWCPPAAARR
jgi:hypothetical protein